MNGTAFKTCAGFVIGTVPVFVVIKDYVGSISRVQGRSMQNTLNPDNEDEYIFISKFNILNKFNIKHGDVVCFISPVNADKTLIKRIVGLDGDTVRAVNYNPKRVKQEFNKIPHGHCWVEGDNRKHSLDSNDFGPISQGLIVGKATHLIWPPKRWGRIETKETCPQRVIKRMSTERFMMWDQCE